MLMVRRRVGERIVIGGSIEVHITAATRNGVRLGVTAPRGVLVLRGEVHDSVAAANTAAVAGPTTHIATAEAPQSANSNSDIKENVG